MIKENGRGIGLFTNAKAILEWSLTSSYVSEMLFDITEKEDDKHHEDNDRYESSFIADCATHNASWASFGNPFKEGPELVHLTRKIILPKEAELSVRNALEIGREQYRKFDGIRESLYDTIHKNNFLLYRQKNITLAKKKKEVVCATHPGEFFFCGPPGRK